MKTLAARTNRVHQPQLRIDIIGPRTNKFGKQRINCHKVDEHVKMSDNFSIEHNGRNRDSSRLTSMPAFVEIPVEGL